MPAMAMAVDTEATAVDTDTEATAVATVATDTARGLLMLRPSPATAMVATAMVATATAVMATTARGLLMPSPRLRPRLSLDTDTVMAVDTDTVAMAAAAVVMAAMDVATTARGLLMPSLRLMLLLLPRLSLATTAVVMAMVATDMAVATDPTARGRLRLSLA